MEGFSKLSTPMKWIGGALLAVGLIGAGTALGSGKWVFLLVLLILLVVLLGGYLLWLAFRRRQKSAEFDSKVGELNRKSHLDVASASERAEIDNARRKFEKGVNEYRKGGQSLYVLPWYLLVGMPGSGKTWCVRQSEVGFLPGMQDEMQGIGGTQYMDWWFTKHAVILDTAGKFMIEGKGWQDFLNLLKKYRPNCPINGVILAIPASDLFQDSKAETAQKAKQIAYQLATIQKVLDVSFPLFVVVTKCDLLPGFREFFAGLEDPRLRHQLFGWSNRASLDAPFDPAWVEQHIDNVVSRLKRRRLGLVAEPLASKAEQRRLDSLDQLYELPQNVAQLAAPLRAYLEEVFTGNVFSCKPPFFRGLFLTTSMQEGVPVDLCKWITLGVRPSTAQAGAEAAPIAQRDKAYFLRDLFQKKIFVEKGLVTTATNALRRRRNWRIAMFASGAVALCLFLAVCLFGKKALRESVMDRSAHWAAAAADWKTNEDGLVWHPLVDRAADPWKYKGRELVEPNITLVAFQGQIRELAQNPAKINWIFRPLKWMVGGNLNESRAQRIVFEASILRPLVQAAREKIVRTPDNADPTPVEQQQSLQATKSLFLIENEILARGWLNRGAAPNSREAEVNYLTPLLAFDASDAAGYTENGTRKDGETLAQVLAWTYSKGDGSGNWPPPSLSGGDTLRTNLALRTGLERMVAFPLVAPVSTNMEALSPEVVRDFSDFMKFMDNLGQSKRLRTSLYNELQARLGWLKPAVTILMSTNGQSVATCRIILPKQSPNVLRRWRVISLVSADVSGEIRTNKFTDQREDFVLAQLDVWQPLKLTLWQNPGFSGPSVSLAAFPNWGAIRMMLANRATPDRGGNSCTLSVPVQGDAASDRLLLRLQFDSPLPDKWPERQEVLNADKRP